MGQNRRAQEREGAAARSRVEAERNAVADAHKIMAIWSARQAAAGRCGSIQRRAITSK
jgi:hypothetical protein